MPQSTHEEIAKLQEEYSRNPEGRLFVHLAEAYRRSGEIQRARDLLLEGLQHHESYLSARILLAEVYAELEDTAAARQTWQQVLEQDAENERALRALAQIEFDSGNRREALAHHRQLKRIGAEDAELAQKRQELERGGGPKKGSAPKTDQQPETRETTQEKEMAKPPTQAVLASEPPATARTTDPRELPFVTPAQTDVIALSEMLVRLIEHRESTFHARSSLTRLLATAIGRELELDQVHLNTLALAALLGDLGQTALGPAPLAPRTSEDGEPTPQKEQQSLILSLQLLHGITLPDGVLQAIRHQHERWDGNGHPTGLRDENIPYSARIIAVARACADLLTYRSDQPARSVAAALDELQRDSGSRYDPTIVGVLRRVFQNRTRYGLGYGLGGQIAILHAEELRALSLGMHLHAHGYMVEMEPTWPRVRDHLRTSPLKALVVDAVRSGGDVAKLVREVRATPEAAGIPIIVVDANDVEARVEYLTAGADACLSSEVDFREIRAILDALLRRTEGDGSEGST